MPSVPTTPRPSRRNWATCCCRCSSTPGSPRRRGNSRCTTWPRRWSPSWSTAARICSPRSSTRTRASRRRSPRRNVPGRSVNRRRRPAGPAWTASPWPSPRWRSRRRWSRAAAPRAGPPIGCRGSCGWSTSAAGTAPRSGCARRCWPSPRGSGPPRTPPRPSAVRAPRCPPRTGDVCCPFVHRTPTRHRPERNASPDFDILWSNSETDGGAATGRGASPVPIDRVAEYPRPDHILFHFSDTHLIAGDGELYGAVDADERLRELIAHAEASRIKPTAIVFTGDLVDRGEPDAYDKLRALVEPFARRVGAPVIWVMGNHDDRRTMRRRLLDQQPTGLPFDEVHTVDGLRVIALDTTVPGHHHGEVTDEQLDWLRDEIGRASCRARGW